MAQVSCPACGAQIDEAVTVCPSCGTSQPGPGPFDVLLLNAGDQEPATILAVEAAGHGLDEAKAIVDGVPAVLATDQTRAAADTLIAAMDDVGASAVRRTPGDWRGARPPGGSGQAGSSGSWSSERTWTSSDRRWRVRGNPKGLIGLVGFGIVFLAFILTGTMGSDRDDSAGSPTTVAWAATDADLATAICEARVGSSLDYPNRVEFGRPQVVAVDDGFTISGWVTDSSSGEVVRRRWSCRASNVSTTGALTPFTANEVTITPSPTPSASSTTAFADPDGVVQVVDALRAAGHPCDGTPGPYVPRDDGFTTAPTRELRCTTPDGTAVRVLQWPSPEAWVQELSAFEARLCAEGLTHYLHWAQGYWSVTAESAPNTSDDDLIEALDAQRGPGQLALECP